MRRKYLKLKCTNCGHVWDTRKGVIPQLCPNCCYRLYHHTPKVWEEKTKRWRNPEPKEVTWKIK